MKQVARSDGNLRASGVTAMTDAVESVLPACSEEDDDDYRPPEEEPDSSEDSSGSESDADSDDSDDDDDGGAQTARDTAPKGKKRRFRYNIEFKAAALTKLDEANANGVHQQQIANELGIHPAMLSRWKQKAETIFHEAGNSRRRRLLIVGSASKYSEMEKQLFAEFQSRRTRGHRVTERWLCVRARVIVGGTFRASHGWRIRFAKRYNITPRRKTNTKKLSAETRLPQLRHWHTELVRDVISKGQSVDPKRGRFRPEQRYNADQIPLPFCVDLKKTFEEKGAKRVWVRQPGEGLDKRMCTVFLTIRGDGMQPVPLLVFRGKGKRISKDELAAYPPGVVIVWQPKAWVDRDTAVKWAERVMVPFVKQHNKDQETILFMDRLDAHVSCGWDSGVCRVYSQCKIIAGAYGFPSKAATGGKHPHVVWACGADGSVAACGPRVWATLPCSCLACSS